MLSSERMMRVDDMIITVAYFSIPVQILVSLYRYPRLASMPPKILILMVLFALFIFLCGAGHLIRCLRYTESNLFSIVNWCTAFISMTTAIYLLPLVPNLMSSLDEGLQELRRLNRETEESRRKLVTFMAFLCHEIRNPLFAITSFCAFLEDEKLSRNQERALSSIQQSADLMLRLVNDVLDISKLESGRLELEQEEFQLREMLQNVGTSTEMQLRTKPGVNFAFHLAPNVPHVVVGDSARILQVAYNLLSNAAKFTDEGSIEFKASMVGYDEAVQKEWINSGAADFGDNLLVFDGDLLLHSSTSPLDSHAVDVSDFETRLLKAEEGTLLPFGSVCVLKIEVTDTGTGIAPDLLERIFVPYSWSKLTDYRQHGGTGLGLSIISKLSKKMGGTIHVTSKEGEGSTFTVYLQLHLPIQRHEVEGSHGARRIIVVEPVLPNLMPRTYSASSGEETRVSRSPSSTDPLVGTGHAKTTKEAQCTACPPSKPSLELLTFAARGQKVLVVDDNQINRKLIGRMLAHINLAYELAEDGQEAVDIMMMSRNITGDPSATDYGLIIMDIDMPVLDGCQATRILRANDLDIPILALTACPVDVSKQDAIEAGATEFLTKPILRDHLYQKCRYYLDARGATSIREVI